MGTKKGQVRKTARRAYEPKKRTRKQKVTLAQMFRQTILGASSQSTSKRRRRDEMLDDYNTLERLLYGRR
jgi:hypothetical protein